MLRFKNSFLIGALALLMGTVCLNSCKKDISTTQPTPLSSYNMSAHANGIFYTFNATVQYVGLDTIDILGSWNSNIDEDYYFNFYTFPLKKGKIGTYLVSVAPGADFHALPVGGSIYDFDYMTDNTHTGTLTISAYDSVNNTISGTFNFTAYGCSDCIHNVNGTISVTNGVFTKLQL